MWYEMLEVYVCARYIWLLGQVLLPLAPSRVPLIRRYALNSNGASYLPLVIRHLLYVRDYSGDTEWLTKTWHKDFEIPIKHPHPYLITISRMIAAGKVSQRIHAYTCISGNRK